MRGRIFNMYHLCVWKLSKGSNWESHIWKNNAQLLKLLLFFDYWQNFIKKVQRYFLFSKMMYYSWFYVVLVSDVQHSESVTHYTYPFSDSIPVRAITELWVEFPVLYHRSLLIIYLMHSSVTMLLFSCLVVSDSLRLPGLQHARLPCPLPIPGVCSTSCPLNQWYHPTTLSSVIPPSSCLQSLWESGSFPALHIRRPKYCSFSFSISPSNEYSGLISFRIDLFDLLAAQGTLKCLLQHPNSKASILQCSAFFMVQLTSVHYYWKNHSFVYFCFVNKFICTIF